MKNKLKYKPIESDDLIRPLIVSDTTRRVEGRLANEVLLSVPTQGRHLTSDEVDILLDVIDTIGLKLTLSNGFILSGPKDEFIDLIAYVIKAARRGLD